MRIIIRQMMDEVINRVPVEITGQIKARLTRSDRRRIFINQLGGKCIKCNFSDWRALQIDHINGNGTNDIKKYGSSAQRYYREVLASIQRKEEKYQLLCANCNWIKRYENTEHKPFIGF